MIRRTGELGLLAAERPAAGANVFRDPPPRGAFGVVALPIIEEQRHRADHERRGGDLAQTPPVDAQALREGVDLARHDRPVAGLVVVRPLVMQEKQGKRGNAHEKVEQKQRGKPDALEEGGRGRHLQEAQQGDVPPGAKVLLLKQQDQHHVGQQVGDRDHLHRTPDLEQLPERQQHREHHRHVRHAAVDAKHPEDVRQPDGRHRRKHGDHRQVRILLAQPQQDRAQGSERSHVDCQHALEVQSRGPPPCYAW